MFGVKTKQYIAFGDLNNRVSNDKNVNINHFFKQNDHLIVDYCDKTKKRSFYDSKTIYGKTKIYILRSNQISNLDLNFT